MYGVIRVYIEIIYINVYGMIGVRIQYIFVNRCLYVYIWKYISDYRDFVYESLWEEII